MQAWQGLTADGPPEGGVAYFQRGTTPADMAALAWVLEENTRLFYNRLKDMRPGTREASLFVKLADAEERHKTALASIHQKMGSEPIERFLAEQDPPIIEGGVSMAEALQWAKDRPLRKILSYSMGFEANAYDRYMKMFNMAENEDAKKVFENIAIEEKEHLIKLGELLDQEVGKEA